MFIELSRVYQTFGRMSNFGECVNKAIQFSVLTLVLFTDVNVFPKDREREEIRRNPQKHPIKYLYQRHQANTPAKTLAPQRYRPLRD